LTNYRSPDALCCVSDDASVLRMTHHMCAHIISYDRMKDKLLFL